MHKDKSDRRASKFPERARTKTNDNIELAITRKKSNVLEKKTTEVYEEFVGHERF